jgi:hypothetical protein
MCFSCKFVRDYCELTPSLSDLLKNDYLYHYEGVAKAKKKLPPLKKGDRGGFRMADNILIVRYFVWHANLPQPLFDKEGSFYNAF